MTGTERLCLVVAIVVIGVVVVLADRGAGGGATAHTAPLFRQLNPDD